MLRGTGTSVLEEAKASFEQFLYDPEEYDRNPRRWTQPMLPPRRKTGTIYFVGCAEIARVKIGYSQAQTVRLAELQCGSPVELEILATVIGTMDREREYHALFAAHRLHGEWFERCPEIEAEIARLTPPSEDIPK